MPHKNVFFNLYCQEVECFIRFTAERLHSKKKNQLTFCSCRKLIYCCRFDTHHFTDGASLLGSLLSAGGTKLCVHEADLTCDGLSQHRQSCGVVTLRWWKEEKDKKTDQASHSKTLTQTHTFTWDSFTSNVEVCLKTDQFAVLKRHQVSKRSLRAFMFRSNVMWQQNTHTAGYHHLQTVFRLTISTGAILRTSCCSRVASQ